MSRWLAIGEDALLLIVRALEIDEARLAAGAHRVHERSVRGQACELRRWLGIAREDRAVRAKQRENAGAGKLGIILDEIVGRDRDRGHAGKLPGRAKTLAAEREEARIAALVGGARRHDV